MKSKFYSSLHLPFNTTAAKQSLLHETLRVVDCGAKTSCQWDVLFGGSLIRWFELKSPLLFQYVFERHLF